MEFPFYLHIGSWRLHPHVVFEALSYFIGFRVYLWTRVKGKMPPFTGLQIIAGAAVGAALGSKLLFWLEDPLATWNGIREFGPLWGGKTIVGGLLGGLIGVELMKRWIGWKSSTGDDFVYPLIVGIAIGRIGCFLTGLEDRTYGIETTWMTGIDFGDGILRHPTQLYEIVFLLGLAVLIWPLRKRVRTSGQAAIPSGTLFQCFMAAYLLFRWMIDFIKPVPDPYFGLNNIQLACIAGLLYYGRLLWNNREHFKPSIEAHS